MHMKLTRKVDRAMLTKLYQTSFVNSVTLQSMKSAVSAADLHRPVPHSRELDRILCIKEERTVRNDFTILHYGTLYQIEEAIRARKVLVEERLDGSLHLSYKGREIPCREIARKQAKEEAKAARLIHKKKGGTPPPTHPWRRDSMVKRETKDQLPVRI